MNYNYVSKKAEHLSSKEHICKSIDIGKNGEDNFEKALKNSKINYTKATEEQNIKEHIDFLIDGKGVDVKGFKKSQEKGFLVIEFKNVLGKYGWCSEESKAYFIAFDFNGFFIVVKKDELLKYCRENVINEYCDFFDYEKCYKKLYSRKNRNDLMTILNKKDLYNLPFILLLRYEL